MNSNQYLNEYYANNAQKLRNKVDKILTKFGGLSQKDYDDFYSLANEVFTDVLKRYDNSQDFDGFLYSCLLNKIKTEMTSRNREKRKADRMSISIETPIGENDTGILADVLVSDFSLDQEINGLIQDEKVEKYLESLQKNERKIIEMKMEGYDSSEIKEKLNLSNKEYLKCMNNLKLYEKIKYLFRNEDGYCNADIEEEKEMSNTTTQTMENCKTDKISVAAIIKKIDKHTIRFDHPLQRESDQWSPSMKGNLVSDMLQGNRLHPLIFAEQIINGVPIIWDLDGKQRCTNAYSFSKNGYRISKNIRRWMIKYQTTEKDENGNDVLDKNGFPIAKNEEFDIRGKKFSDLPEELQDRFLEYNFNYDQYLNCSEEDIGYHIERYNDGKNMNPAQKGTVKLGTEYAEMVKSISAMPFFRDMGGYKVSDFKNGTINRVVVESIMSSNFMDDWKKNQEDMCKYIKNHATVNDFDNFEDMIERLEKVVTDDVSDMFDSKDSFLWFGLFARFVNTGLDDEKFVEFMAEFSQSLHSKEIDGTTYDELCIDPKTGNTRSTKDKYIVVPKMKLLETLMYEYLHINEEDINEVDTLEFIKDNIDPDAEENDVEQYEEVLDDLTLNVDNSSKLMDEQNRLSLVAMVAYSFKHDIDLDDWLVKFFEQNNGYIRNQKQNYLHMVENLNQYISCQKQISA